MPEIGIEESICVVETPADEEKSESALSKCAPSTSVNDVVPVASTLELHQRILPEVEDEATTNANTASGFITAVHYLKLPIGAEKNICIPKPPLIDGVEESTTSQPNHAQSPGAFDAVPDTHEFEAFTNARPKAEDSITIDVKKSIDVISRNLRTSGTSTMAASMCALGIAQSGPKKGSARHGNLPHAMAIGTPVDLHNCRNQEEQHFEEGIPETGYQVGTLRLLGYLTRIRLYPVLPNYLMLSPVRILAAEVLNHLGLNSHRVMIVLLLLSLPLLVQDISGYMEKVQQDRHAAFWASANTPSRWGGRNDGTWPPADTRQWQWPW